MPSGFEKILVAMEICAIIGVFTVIGGIMYGGYKLLTLIFS